MESRLHGGRAIEWKAGAGEERRAVQVGFHGKSATSAVVSAGEGQAIPISRNNGPCRGKRAAAADDRPAGVDVEGNVRRIRGIKLEEAGKRGNGVEFHVHDHGPLIGAGRNAAAVRAGRVTDRETLGGGSEDLGLEKGVAGGVGAERVVGPGDQAGRVERSEVGKVTIEGGVEVPDSSRIAEGGMSLGGGKQRKKQAERGFHRNGRIVVCDHRR